MHPDDQRGVVGPDLIHQCEYAIRCLPENGQLCSEHAGLQAEFCGWTVQEMPAPHVPVDTGGDYIPFLVGWAFVVLVLFVSGLVFIIKGLRRENSDNMQQDK